VLRFVAPVIAGILAEHNVATAPRSGAIENPSLSAAVPEHVIRGFLREDDHGCVRHIKLPGSEYI
jgi:hypothetical protein